MKNVMSCKAQAAVIMVLAFCAMLAIACSVPDSRDITVTDESSVIKNTEEVPTETSRHIIVINPTVSSEDTTVKETEGEFETTIAVMGRIEQIMSEMTLEEKVGQLFIARCPNEDAVNKAVEYHLGGYILFGSNFKDKTKEQTVKEIADIQAAVSIPLLIGVDEEGGTVNRISRYKTFRQEPFKSPKDLYVIGGFEAIRSDTIEKCELLKSLGINLNFAPVCDISLDETDFMYKRAFGISAEMTAKFVEFVVRIMNEQGMGSVLKHFPGYGNNADTHTGVAYDNRLYETFVNSDFLPFKAGIDAGADIVLVSHNVVSSIDGELPASLSERVHEILRNELGFTGVIVTDDLAMEGVRSFADDAQVAALAVKAGNDLLCCTNFEEQVPAVIEAVRNGEISEEQIESSVYRILQMKISLGIIE